MKLYLLCTGFLFLLWQFGFWVLFRRLRIPPYVSLLPGYNLYRFCKVVWGTGMYCLFFLLPLGNLFFWACSLHRAGKGFCKSNAFSWGLVCLFPVFVIWLPSKQDWKRPRVQTRRLYVCIGLLSLIGCLGSGYALSKGYVPCATGIYGAHAKRPQVVLSEQDLSTHPAFAMTKLSKGVTVPLLKGSEVRATDALFEGDGLRVSVTLPKTETSALGDELSRMLEAQKEELLGTGFVNPVIGDLYGPMNMEQEAMCQLNYETPQGGKGYRMFRLSKQDALVLVTVDYDSTLATETTMPLLAEICTVYGMTFQGDMITRDVTKPINQ